MLHVKKKIRGCYFRIIYYEYLERAKTDGWGWTNSLKLRTVKVWASFWSNREVNLWHVKGIIFIETLSLNMVQIKNMAGFVRFQPSFHYRFWGLRGSLPKHLSHWLSNSMCGFRPLYDWWEQLPNCITQMRILCHSTTQELGEGLLNEWMVFLWMMNFLYKEIARLKPTTFLLAGNS